MKPTREKFLLDLEQGEGQYVEFKSAWEFKDGRKKPGSVKDILRNVVKGLVTFANAEGGTLYLGVEDDGTPTDIPHSENRLDDLKRNFPDLLLNARDFPAKSPRLIEHAGLKILAFNVGVNRQRVFQTADGKSFKRIGESSRPYSVENIQEERFDDRSARFDREICPQAKSGDIDWQRVEKVAGIIHPNQTPSPQRFLNIHGLSELNYPEEKYTNACVLLFAKKDRIPFHFPKSALRFVSVNGPKLLPGEDYNLENETECTGNVFDILEEHDRLFDGFYQNGETFGRDAVFRKKYLFPPFALKECLVNALAHRCYLTSSDVRFFRYSNGLEFVNPGTLQGIGVADLYQDVPAQATRNVLIAKILRLAGHMRQLGEGLLRVKAEAEKRGTQASFMSNTHVFSLYLPLEAEKNADRLSEKLKTAERELGRDDPAQAGKYLRELIQSGFLGIAFDSLNPESAESARTLWIQSVQFPELAEERKPLKKWMENQPKPTPSA